MGQPVRSANVSVHSFPSPTPSFLGQLGAPWAIPEHPTPIFSLVLLVALLCPAPSTKSKQLTLL